MLKNLRDLSSKPLVGMMLTKVKQIKESLTHVTDQKAIGQSLAVHFLDIRILETSLYGSLKVAISQGVNKYHLKEHK